jgi:hypothetical protein
VATVVVVRAAPPALAPLAVVDVTPLAVAVVAVAPPARAAVVVVRPAAPGEVVAAADADVGVAASDVEATAIVAGLVSLDVSSSSPHEARPTVTDSAPSAVSASSRRRGWSVRMLARSPSCDGVAVAGRPDDACGRG